MLSPVVNVFNKQIEDNSRWVLLRLYENAVPQGFWNEFALVGFLWTNRYSTMWNLSKYSGCKQCLLIEQIQIEEYTLEKLVPKPKHQKLDKQKLSGRNYLEKGVSEEN